MKERRTDYERPIVARWETPKVAQSGDGAFDGPRSLVAAQQSCVAGSCDSNGAL